MQLCMGWIIIKNIEKIGKKIKGNKNKFPA